MEQPSEPAADPLRTSWSNESKYELVAPSPLAKPQILELETVNRELWLIKPPLGAAPLASQLGDSRANGGGTRHWLDAGAAAALQLRVESLAAIALLADKQLPECSTASAVDTRG